MWLLMCDYLKYNRDVAQMFNFDQTYNIVLLTYGTLNINEYQEEDMNAEDYQNDESEEYIVKNNEKRSYHNKEKFQSYLLKINSMG